MSYTQDIPVSGDSLGGTRDRIRTNFQLISSVFGQNHLTFGQSNQGLHKYVVMPEADTLAAPDGVPGTNANEAALFMNPGDNPAETNLFIRGESNGNNWELTRLDNANFARFGKEAASAPSLTLPNGWTFLPGGLIMQWGEVPNVVTTGTVTFNVKNINFPSTILSVFTSLNKDSNESSNVHTLTTTSFQYRTTTSSGTGTLYWWALGF